MRVAKSIGVLLVLMMATTSTTVAQKGGRTRPTPRVEPRPTPRPEGRTEPRLESQDSTTSDIFKELQIRSELKEKLGREPTFAEMSAEKRRRQAEIEKMLGLDQAAKERAAERARQQDLEDIELLRQSADPANIVVEQAIAPPPTNVRVRILREGGRPAFEFTRGEAERRFREIDSARLLFGASMVRDAITGLDAAAFGFAHQKLPPKLPLRFLTYDPRTRDLNVYSEYAGRQMAERSWKMPPDTSGKSLASVELRVFLRASGRVVCYCPELPEAFREAIAETSIEYVRGIEQSANNTTAMRLSAAQLGERRFDAARAEMFDALPNIRLGLLGLWDTWRMNLNFADRFEWRKFREEVKVPEGIPTRAATARDFIDALRNGEKDVLLVIAHNDGTFLYMPSGQKIAFSDIAALKRAVTPERVVVLITCEGATPHQNLASLAQLLLQNRLARSVFASENLVDARQLPSILESLKSSSTLRAVLRQFQFDQFVENTHDNGIGFSTTGTLLRPWVPRA